MNTRDIAIGLLVITVWGLNFIAIKLGVHDVPPLLLGALRFFLACVPVIFFLPKPQVSWPWLIALGLFLNVGQFAFLFIGIKVGMPAGLSSLVLQAQAFFTLLIAVLWFGERWQWNHIAGIFLAACGIVIIGFQQGASMSIAGFCFTLAAAASWGTGNVIMKRISQTAPPFSMLSLVVWASAVAVLPFLALSWVLEGYDAWLMAFHSAGWPSMISLLYIVYGATLVGFGLWGKLLSRYPAAVVSPFSLLVPIVGMSSSYLFLGEALSIAQIAGALLIMAGLMVHVFGGAWGIMRRGDQEKG